VLLYASIPASYENCIGCHGVYGEKSVMQKSKIIKNLTIDEFVSAFKGYKNKTYGGPYKALMSIYAKRLSDDEIKEIYKYLRLKK
jgi:cytochrome c553